MLYSLLILSTLCFDNLALLCSPGTLSRGCILHFLSAIYYRLFQYPFYLYTIVRRLNTSSSLLHGLEQAQESTFHTSSLAYMFARTRHAILTSQLPNVGSGNYPRSILLIKFEPGYKQPCSKSNKGSACAGDRRMPNP